MHFVYTQRQERSLGHTVHGTSQQQIQHVRALVVILSINNLLILLYLQTKLSRDFQIPPATATAGRQMTSI